MAGGVVCYIERHGAGSQIRRIRLVAAGLVRVWTAPEAGSVSSVDQAGPGPALTGVKAAAAFVVQTLAGVGLKRLASVCVDADGAVCAWLSAPSPESAVIKATVQQASGEGDAAGAGVGAARLLAMGASSGSGESDVTLQALALAEPEAPRASNGAAGHGSSNGSSNGGGLARLPARLLGRRNGTPDAGGLTRKSRYAVLAVPDAPVRVFLDELDRQGIEVETVRSLWHGLAEAWDPGAGGAGSARGARTNDVVDSEGPAAGVVMVDPDGRLVWAWTRGAELVAGGTMRLATFAKSAAADTSSGNDAPSDGSRLLPVPAGSEDGPPMVLEFSEADAGRLTMDWLAWSAQLGHCPRRIVCLSTPNLGAHSTGEGPRVLPALLARSWPGATVDAVVHEDPIGATLARMAGLGPTPTSPTTDTPQLTGARHELVSLSARPGRADRALHTWIAIALFGVAAVLGVAAWRMYASVGTIDTQTAATRASRTEVETEVGTLVNDPNFSKYAPPQQTEMISSVLKSKQTTLRNIKPPRPVLQEAVYLMQAIGPDSGVELSEFELTPVLVRVTLNVPDADAGPGVLERLRKTGTRILWEGSTPQFRREGQRQYVMWGTWNEAAPGAPARPASGGAP